MAPRPLTSIFMAPPPPSRPTASGGQSGSGPTTPTYNPAYPGLPVTALPEGGISIIVPSGNDPEPEAEPEPVWVPKARLALAKSSVWDGMAPILPSSMPTGNISSRHSSIVTVKPTNHTPKPHVQPAQIGNDALSDPDHPRKRHLPRNPLDPHRLALISNALGVSIPIPPRAVLEGRLSDDRVRKASLDDATLTLNHARASSLASFRSGPTPMRSATSLSVNSRRPVLSASSSVSTFPVVATPSQPTRFLLHVYPPPHMPSLHPFASRTPPPGYHSQFRRGTLVALHASLPGQLSAIAKEYGLPSTSGMCVYLLSADYEPPEEDDDDVPPQRGDERALGPRIGEEPWKMLWAALLKADRDEMMRSFNPNEAGSITGSPASALAALGGEESPPPNGEHTLSHKSSVSSFSPRPLKTVAAMNSKEVFKSIPLSATSQSSGTASTALSRNPSLATSQSRTSSPTTTLSSGKINIMPTLPIVGKIEFDIDMRRAPWYETFCNRAHQQMAQRRLPSRVETPVGPLATPAPRSRSPSPVTLNLPPRARSASPAGVDTLFAPRSASPSSSKFPMHLQLPSNPANRSDRGLLSPKDARLPTPSSSDDETIGLGLQLSPSSSTVADGMMLDVVPEGGYAALSDDEDEDDSGRGHQRSGRDPLGDVFPEEETWNVSTRAIKGIEDLPIPEPDEDELPPGDSTAEVVQLWNEHNRPGISLAPPPPSSAPAVPAPEFSRPADPSRVVFPKPAPARQRSDSVKRPPPLKLEEQQEAEKEELGQTEIVVTGEDGEDWNWRSSEHVRKERLDELEKVGALAQLSPRILQPPPPDLDRPRSPGLHSRMLSGGTLRAGAARPDPHAPLFMSEELSNLKASMAAKKGGSTPTTPRTPPMTTESRIRMQNEHKLDLANLPPPETAPPRPRRPQTPVALNSPPFEDSPPVPSQQQRSRFSMDSNGEDVSGLTAPNRERANSIMSVKGIKKLWRGRNSTQNLNGLAAASANRDSQLPVNSGAGHKRDSSNSGKDPFHFDQDLTKDKEGKPATKSILKKWSVKPNDPKLSPKPTQSARGSISSVNTLTSGANGLQATDSGRPSVSSSLASDGEPMTPRMSQFEMVVSNDGQQQQQQS
ncbi:hypothetical protein RHS04_01898 [Rhizoctonia solani]|uniref:Uncharacterized protein n=1 Tax=Rhizoctonia solani TaxID=456999 RepID=A0A8H7LLP7_9AGAM|nr:hypothetical protein RHS04_01898 [Rhizoctonia solani]